MKGRNVNSKYSRWTICGNGIGVVGCAIDSASGCCWIGCCWIGCCWICCSSIRSRCIRFCSWTSSSKARCCSWMRCRSSSDCTIIACSYDGGGGIDSRSTSITDTSRSVDSGSDRVWFTAAIFALMSMRNFRNKWIDFANSSVWSFEF